MGGNQAGGRACGAVERAASWATGPTPERPGASAGLESERTSEHHPRPSAEFRLLRRRAEKRARASPARPSLGLRAGTPRVTDPQSLSATPSRRPNSHDPLQQGPFLRALRRSQEQGTRAGGLGVCGRGGEGCEPPPKDVEAAGEIDAPWLAEPARMLWSWLCSRAAAPAGGEFPDAWSPAAPRGPLEGCRVRPSGKGALLSGLWPLGGALPRGLVSRSCRPRHPPGPGLPWDPASPLLSSHPILAPSSHKRSWAVTWPNRAPHCSFPPPWEGTLSVPPTPGTRGRKGSPSVVP